MEGLRIEAGEVMEAEKLEKLRRWAWACHTNSIEFQRRAERLDDLLGRALKANAKLREELQEARTRKGRGKGK